MLERPHIDVASAAARSLTRRRMLFAALTVVTAAILWSILAGALWPITRPADVVALGLFALTLPWPVIGFWNAVIGFLVMRLAADPVAAVFPAAARVPDDAPVTAATAVLLCIRNEDTARVTRNLQAMMAELADSGRAERFHVYVLSDTGDAVIASAEEQTFAALTAEWRGRVALTYRRRTDNAGFKAGNIRDFCERWGHDHDLAITLDADSLMPAAAMLRLVRIMQANPAIGIVQGLIVGMPSASAFARVFQFGMRLGMRSYTLGSAWWQGDCGPYWGHNAIIRLRPFIVHCRLPELPARGALGGPILSHDQIEAVLMRRAGYEVRALPREDLGWEENPPTLLEFMRRDLRWCHGNMQYWRLLALPGLKPISRYQLVLAILMFVSSPAWMLLLAIGTALLVLAQRPADIVKPEVALLLFATMLAMSLAPKLATVLDVLLRADLRKGYGGGWRFLASVATEIAFSTLLTPIMWFSHTVYLAGLAIGRRIGWGQQARDDHAVPAALAAHALWPQTVVGCLGLATVAVSAPALFPYALYLVGGLALAIPFAVLTASPGAAQTLLRRGLGRLPEETAPPRMLRAIGITERIAHVHTLESRGPAERLRTAGGVIRSLRIYYGSRGQRRAMDGLYAQFLRPGDLAFDIGAHVGDRIGSFRRLDARVVALEPQPALVRTLKLIYGRDRSVTIEPVAVSDTPGMAVLNINIDNPTVSSASEEFLRSAATARGWEGQRWTRSISVPATTLDALIVRHGLPAFIKIDVEGFELAALNGLTQPVAALSFEFTTMQRDAARACLDRCVALGYARFNAALGESQRFAHTDWCNADAMRAWLAGLPDEANSGDVYALRA